MKMIYLIQDSKQAPLMAALGVRPVTSIGDLKEMIGDSDQMSGEYLIFVDTSWAISADSTLMPYSEKENVELFLIGSDINNTGINYFKTCIKGPLSKEIINEVLMGLEEDESEFLDSNKELNLDLDFENDFKNHQENDLEREGEHGLKANANLPLKPVKLQQSGSFKFTHGEVEAGHNLALAELKTTSHSQPSFATSKEVEVDLINEQESVESVDDLDSKLLNTGILLDVTDKINLSKMGVNLENTHSVIKRIEATTSESVITEHNDNEVNDNEVDDDDLNMEEVQNFILKQDNVANHIVEGLEGFGEGATILDVTNPSFKLDLKSVGQNNNSLKNHEHGEASMSSGKDQAKSKESFLDDEGQDLFEIDASPQDQVGDVNFTEEPTSQTKLSQIMGEQSQESMLFPDEVSFSEMTHNVDLDKLRSSNESAIVDLTTNPDQPAAVEEFGYEQNNEENELKRLDQKQEIKQKSVQGAKIDKLSMEWLDQEFLDEELEEDIDLNINIKANNRPIHDVDLTDEKTPITKMITPKPGPSLVLEDHQEDDQENEETSIDDILNENNEGQIVFNQGQIGDVSSINLDDELSSKFDLSLGHQEDNQVTRVFSAQAQSQATNLPPPIRPPEKPIFDESFNVSSLNAFEEEKVRLAATIRQLREERQTVLTKIEDEKRKNDDVIQENLGLKAELEEIKIEMEIIKKRHLEELEDFKNQTRLLQSKKGLYDEKIKKYQKDIQQYEKRVKVDVGRIRQRESELENQLELVRHDAQSQVQTRDEKILELKRKIDTLEFNMENMSIQEKKAREDKNLLEEKLLKVMKTLRGSLHVLEEDSELDSEIISKMNELKNL